jgi:tetratricopeptide (TPR) repeat protein
MKTIAKQITAVSVLLACLAGLPMSVQAQGGLRAEVQKPLAAAQEALKNQQAEQALRLATDAAALPSLTPTEQWWIWRVQAVAALRLQQWGFAIERLEGALALPEAPVADKLGLMESLVHASAQNKEPARTVRVARQYLQAGGTNPGVRTAVLQGLSLLGDYPAVVKEAQNFVQQDEARQRKTPESDLRLWGAASQRLKDDAGYLSVLKRLLATYPSNAYWADAIVRVTNLPGFNSRYELDAYRLLAETGNLEEASQYTEMASLALKAGLPAEAVRVLAQGYEQGVLGKGAEAAAQARLRTQAQKKLQEDEALMPQLERGAADGNTWMAVGEAYAAKQDWTAAVTAFEKALKLGGLRREAELRLHYGVALFKAGQKPQALAQWHAIRDDSSAQELASLWGLMAR